MSQEIKLSLYITFLALYFIMSIIHLAFCYFEKKLARQITKPFIYTFLALALYFYVGDYPLIYIACILSVLGDIFMIFRRKTPCFIIAGLCFISEHVLNMISQASILSYPIPWWAYLICYLSPFIIGLIAYLIKHKNPIIFLAAFFMSFHLLNIAFSFMLIGDRQFLYGTLIYIGYLIYLLSDYLIYHFVFVKRNQKDHFYVMLTYIIGQTLILLTLTYASINLLR